MRLELRAHDPINAQRAQPEMKLRNLIFAVVLGTAMAAGIWMAMNVQRTLPAPTTATVLPSPADMPAFSLLDHDGRRIDQNVFVGQWDLVFFGFTHCPDVCPLTLQTLSAVKRRLEEAGQAPLPRIVLVSVDPERDTPAVMSRYIAAYGDNTLGITGELDELRKLTGGLGVFFQKNTGDDGSYSVDHSAVVIVVDPAGRFHSLFSGSHVIENFVHDLPLIMASAETYKPPVVASNIKIIQALPGASVSAGYMTLTNNSDDAVLITRVTSPQYGTVSFHQTSIEDDIARMRPIAELTIPPGESIDLEPGGTHLMLMRQRNDVDTVTLDFHSEDTIVISINTSLLSPEGN